MTINTRKHTSSVHLYIFKVTALAFGLMIVAVNASFGQSPSTDRDNSQFITKPKPRRATSNAMLDPAKAPQAPTALLIDSFKVGAYSTPLVIGADLKINIPQKGLDPGEVIYGKRQIDLRITNPDKQPASFQLLTSKPALTVSAGYNVSPGVVLTYAIPPASADLNLKYDRFLVDFDGLDHGMDLTITVFGVDKKVDGHTDFTCRIIPPPLGPFTLSFPFSRFQSSEVLKTTNTLVFNFGATSTGLDYAITRITAAKGDPGKHIVTCLK